MFKKLLVVSVALSALAGCQMTTTKTAAVAPGAAAVASADAALVQKFAGAKLTSLDTGQVINANADGTLTGAGVKGTWTIKNGQWCRTLTEPKAFAGSACQKMDIQGNVMTLTRANGSTARYSF